MKYLKIKYKGFDGNVYYSFYNMEADQGLWTIPEVVERHKEKDHVLKVLRTKLVREVEAKDTIKQLKARYVRRK